MECTPGLEGDCADSARVIESVIDKFLKWAHANSNSFVGRPSKPYAVIVINASGGDTPDDEWQPDAATHSLLSSQRADIADNATFQKYVTYWRERGNNQPIFDMKQLLLMYYTDIKVIRLPARNRLDLLDKQRNRLHDVVTEFCKLSHRIKDTAHMLPDADELQIYLELAFDHFSESLDIPFDFVAASVKNNPAPRNLSERILELAVVMASPKGQEPPRFPPTKSAFDERFTEVISSYILLHANRQHLLGKIYYFRFLESYY